MITKLIIHKYGLSLPLPPLRRRSHTCNFVEAGSLEDIIFSCGMEESAGKELVVLNGDVLLQVEALDVDG